MDKLTTATGKTFDCDVLSVIGNPQICYIFLPGLSILDAARIFYDKRETNILYYGDYTITGFTQLQDVSLINNSVRITLGKE